MNADTIHITLPAFVFPDRLSNVLIGIPLCHYDTKQISGTNVAPRTNEAIPLKQPNGHWCMFMRCDYDIIETNNRYLYDDS